MVLEATGRYENLYLPHERLFRSAGATESELEGVDLVVLQRPTVEDFRPFVAEMQRRRIPYVFEMDDDLWRVARHNPSHWLWSQKRVRKLLQQLAASADMISVSTEALRDVVEERVGHAHIAVQPNFLHPTLWGEDALRDIPLADNGDNVVIGWQGSGTHNNDMVQILPALAVVLARHPNVMLRFFGNVPACIQGVIPPHRFEWMRGVPFAEYPRNLKHAHFDIALAPLAPTKFNESKSNIRVLEAAALGVPTVASPTVYAGTIDNGVNGFVCHDLDAWVDALSWLVTRPDARTQMGADARAQIAGAWGAARGHAWVANFDRLLEGRHA
jgi:glycosyltransferase involved in cell wall biosynthesis